jgi:hypothetical protein
VYDREQKDLIFFSINACTVSQILTYCSMLKSQREGHARPPLVSWEHKDAKQVHFKVRILLELLNCGTMFVTLFLRIIVMSLSSLLNHILAQDLHPPHYNTSYTLLTNLAHTHLSRLNKKILQVFHSNISLFVFSFSLPFHSLCLFILLVFSFNLPCFCFLSLFLV